MAEAGLEQDAPALTMRDRSQMYRELLNKGHTSSSATAQLDALGFPTQTLTPPASAGLEEEEVSGDPSSLENILKGTYKNVVVEPIGGFGEGLYVPEKEGVADDISRFAGEKLSQLSDFLSSGEGYQDWQRRLAEEEADAPFMGKLRNAVETEAGDLLASVGIMAATKGKGAHVLAMQNYGRALEESANTQLREEFGGDEEAYRKARREDPIHYQRLQVSAAATAALDTLSDAIPILKGPGGELFKPAAEKTMKKVLARHGGKMTKQAMAEAVTEVAQTIQNVSINDPDVRNKLTAGDLEGAYNTIIEKHGEELALAAAAGGTLGGVAGGGVSVMEGADPEKTEERTKHLEEIAKDHGLSEDTLQNILQDKEKRPEFVADMAKLEEYEANADRMEKSAADAVAAEGADPVALNDLRKAAKNARESANKARDEIFPKYDGGQSVAQVKERKETAEKVQREEVEKTFSEFGITPRKEIVPSEAAAVAKELRLTQDRRAKAEDKVRRLFQSNVNPEKTAAAREELQQAREAELNAKTSAFDFAGDERGKEKAKKDAERETEVAEMTDVLAEMDPAEATRRAKKWKRNAVSGKVNKKKNDEIAKLEDEIDSGSLKASEIRAKQERIAKLRSQVGKDSAALEAAERWLQPETGGQETQSPPLGGEAAPTPSGDTVEVADEAQAGRAPTVLPDKAETATATEKAPAKAEVEAVAAQPNNITPDAKDNLKRARANLKKSPDDPEAEAQADGAATVALQEAGVANPTSRQVSEVISGGGTVAQRINRAAAMSPEPAPTTAAAAVDSAPAPRSGGFDAAAFRSEADHDNGAEITRQFRFKTLVNDLDLKTGTEQEVTDLLRDWTADRGREASATFDADGNVIAIGTNNHVNRVAMPEKDWDRVAYMTHTHPEQTPISMADAEVAAAMGKPMSAILPDGQVVEITPMDGVEWQRVRDFAKEVALTSGDIIEQYNAGDVAYARIEQEAALQAADELGLLNYTKPMEGFNATERRQIRQLVAKLTSDYRDGAQLDDGYGAAPALPAGRRTGGSDTSGTPEARPARAAESDPDVRVRDRSKTVNPEAAGEMANQITQAIQTMHDRNASMGWPVSTLMRDVNDGTISQDQIANAISDIADHFDMEIADAVDSAADSLYPDAREQGGEALQDARTQGLKMLNLMTATGHGKTFRDKVMAKPKYGNAKIEVSILRADPKLKDFLKFTTRGASKFTNASSIDPDDVSGIKLQPTNIMSGEALERAKRSARYLQKQVYRINKAKLNKLTWEDMLGDDIETLKRKYGDDIKIQQKAAEAKLERLRTAAKDIKEEGIRFRYGIDDKGRIYADGEFTPQGSETIKYLFEAKMPDGSYMGLDKMMEVDHTGSGWQIAQIMARDEALSPIVNTHANQAQNPNAEIGDIYTSTRGTMESVIRRDAAQGNEIAKMVVDRMLSDPRWQGTAGRKNIKPAVIAINYGGGKKNFRDAIGKDAGFYETFQERQEDGTYSQPEGLWAYIDNAGIRAVEEMGPATKRLKDWSLNALKAAVGFAEFGNRHEDLQWTVGRDGTYANVVYTEEPDTFQVRDKNGPLKYVRRDKFRPKKTEEVDVGGTARTIFSQIIQGYDADILHEGLGHYAENGGFVSPNHDSYTVPPDQAGNAAASIRQAMYDVMSADDVPARLLREIDEQLGIDAVNEFIAEYNAERKPQHHLKPIEPFADYGSYDNESIKTSIPAWQETSPKSPPPFTGFGTDGAPTVASGIDYEARDSGEVSGVEMATSLPKVAQFAQDNQFPNQRAFKSEVQAQALASQKAQKIDLTKNVDENVDRLADFATEDAMAAFVDNANAVGWYDRKVRAAKQILGEIHPEILTDKAAELRFIWALAVTSNGIKVDKNFEMADAAYTRAKNSGMLPNDIGVGTAKASINNGLSLYNQMSQKMSTDELIDFMTTRRPVREIEAKMVELGITNKKGKPIKVSGEGRGEMLPGAVILGPKIGGGFFSNLYGNFDELTMDRWFMRSVGRWRGNLIEDRSAQAALNRDRLKEAISGLSAEDLKAIRALSNVPVRKAMTKAGLDNLAADIAKSSALPAFRDKINAIMGGEEIRLATNALAKDLDGQKEAPSGAAERTFLRKVFRKTLDRLRANPDMSDMTMSDLQALLWYPEKTLYDTFKKEEGQEAKGYSDEDAPDYENAARKLVANRMGQAGRAGRRGGSPVGYPDGAGQGASTLSGGVDAGVSDRDGGTPVEGEGRAADGGVVRQPEGAAGGYARSEDRVGYADAMRQAGLRMGPEAGQVSVIDPDAEGVARYMAADGKSGFGLDGDNIIGVFADPSQPGSAKRILEAAVANGGRRLDGFDTFLPKVYARGGFKAVARLPFDPQYAPTVEGGALADWDADGMERMGQRNAGKSGWAAPDVVFMVYDPEGATPETDNTVADYDEGVAAQDAALEGSDAQAPSPAEAATDAAQPDTPKGPTVAAGIDWVTPPPKMLGIAQPSTGKTVLQQMSDQLDKFEQTPLDNVVKWLGKTKRQLARGVFNRQAGLGQVEELSGYGGALVHQGMSRMAQLMSNTTGRVAAMMQYGAPQWNPDTQTFGYAEGTKGLAEIFKFNDATDYNKFQGYAYARRDRELMARGQQPRMTDDLRRRYDSVSPEEKARYDAMLDDYGDFNQALRRLMLDTGLIGKEQYDALSRDKDYVPLGRVFPNTEEFGLDTYFGMQGGFNHPDPGVQSLSKNPAKISGEAGTAEFGDLIDAIQKNAAGTLVAASQNLAHARVYDFMSGNMGNDITKLKGVVEAKKLGRDETKARKNALEQDAVTFRKDGKELSWRLKGDPEWTGAVQMALTGLRPVELDAFDRIMAGFNRFQRDVITGIPSFAAASIMRDAGQAFVQSGVNPASVISENIRQATEVIRGASEETRNLMMASGVGGYQMQGMPDQDAASFRKRVRAQESGWLDIARRGMNEWQRAMGATELAGRSAVAKKVKATGQSEADQAYEALNLIDFGQQGAFKAVQRLNRMVLFLNPRLQGLYRLSQPTAGETARQHHTRIVKAMLVRGAMITAVSLALRALIASSDEDEEKYKKLTQQEKAGYWYLPTFGATEKMIRIPKPFEVGALFGTLPVQVVDSIQSENGMSEFGQALRFAGMETFSLNPMPAIVKPMAEIALNRNMFTGREIEGQSQTSRAKQYRTDERTGFVASTLGNKALSPVQLQHLAQGYLGPLGMLVFNAADATAAAMAGTEPEKFRSGEALKKSLQQVAGVGGGSRFLSKTDEEALLQQGREFYEMKDLMDGYANSIKDLRKAGDFEEAKELIEKHDALLSQRKYFSAVNKELTKLNTYKKKLLSDPSLTAEQRAEGLRKFQKRRNELTAKAVERARKAGVRAGFASGFFLGAAA